MSKTTAVDTAASGWTVAARHRRSNLLQRLGLGAAVALVVTPMIGWRICLASSAARTRERVLVSSFFVTSSGRG